MSETSRVLRVNVSVDDHAIESITDELFEVPTHCHRIRSIISEILAVHFANDLAESTSAGDFT